MTMIYNSGVDAERVKYGFMYVDILSQPPALIGISA